MQRSLLITGAASGIGAALVRRLAGPGTALVLHTGSRAAALDAVAAEAVRAGAAAACLTAPLEEPATAGRLADLARERFGRLDGVVANAGFADRRRIGELDDAALARSLQAMTASFLRLVQGALPLLAAPGGRIVAVSSFVAHVFRLGGLHFPASAAAKAGVEALARALAAEQAPRGITVNCVVPGFVRKEAGSASALTGNARADMLALIPFGRVAEPDEVAAAIEFLLGPGAGYITGQLLHVDGGLTL